MGPQLADRLTKEVRSRLMRQVKGRDTKPELAVRSALHRAGFRFRLHRRDLPGRPDIVLPKFKTAIFVHGCFWHGHDCPRGKLPTTNEVFWATKISGNVRRDNASSGALREQGWYVITIWECRLSENLAKTIDLLRTAGNSLRINSQWN
jgi:DNA mismatch endonuclease (patch repair protein)